jgi:hypothetical protein
MNSLYGCVPPCKACRLAEVCMKALQVKEEEEIRLREYRRIYQTTIKLPCGCYALPMDVWVVFGENIERVTCSKHGVQELTKAKKRSMDKQVKEKTVIEDVIPNDPYLFDIPPY